MASEGTGTVRKAGVVGLGTMGSGIAQLCVQAGVPTVAVESTRELAERGKAAVERQLARSVEKGRLTADEKERHSRCSSPPTDARRARRLRPRDRGGLRGPRRQAASSSRELDAVVGADAVLATNTSALLGDRDRRGAEQPERVVGHALLQPGAGAAARRGRPRRAHRRRGVRRRAYAFAERIGKDPIACGDTPGFVVNRILIPVLNDAVRVLEEGTASRRGHRQGDAARHQLADRPARADRPDRHRRPRARVRGALGGVPRAALRAAAAPRAMVKAGSSAARAAAASTATRADDRFRSPRVALARRYRSRRHRPRPRGADVVAPLVGSKYSLSNGFLPMPFLIIRFGSAAILFVLIALFVERTLRIEGRSDQLQSQPRQCSSRRTRSRSSTPSRRRPR